MSIAKKLFFITAIVFAVFISGTLIVQSMFFQKFYISKKKNELESNVIKFKDSYNQSENEDKAGSIIEEFEKSNNYTVVILDENDRIKYLVKPIKGRGDSLRMIEYTDFIKQFSVDTSYFNKIKQSDKPIVQNSPTRKNSQGSLVGILYDKDRNEVIFVFSSLQPVNEAVSVIEEFYKYFYAAAILFIILLASVYSNMIVKPLRKINKIASKMAKLDFSEKCEVVNEDEIGNVAASLNFLSENLNEALSSLRKANTKLEEDIEKERNLEKMRKEFVAAVSHELKTPITLIDGYAVGLKDNIFEGEEEDYYLDIIIDEAKKMGSLVSDMLDLSHLESGSFKLTCEEFNITELIEFTLKKYRTLISEKKIKIELNLIEYVEVFADWNRLEQVLTNFITNALRHVNENGVIAVSMVDKGESIAIEVENTGSSITEEEISKLWDKFYKIDKSRNRKLGGTGIGLSIVKNILMLHNYSFGAENSERGVKFYFNVPKVK